jgi:uncharacterized protein YjbJ (UPF0337 family)
LHGRHPSGGLAIEASKEIAPMSTEDKTKNAAQKGTGAIKETAGKLTNDKDLEAEGRGDQAAGNLKDAGEKVKDAGQKVKDAVKK